MQIETVSPHSLRIVSWNVCDAFTRKFGHLERLRPDIAFLQEVRPECLRYAGLADRSFWIGASGQKGMAVVSYADWKLRLAPVAVDERWFLPVEATNGSSSINVVGVWIDSTQRDLATPTLAALGTLREFLSHRACILAGDFNQTVTMDKNKSVNRRFATVIERLKDLGLTSAWHRARNELHGEETSASLFWTWNQQRPFHIDFAFGSADLVVEEAHLGSYEDYVAGRISDHVPLVVDYSLKTKPG